MSDSSIALKPVIDEPSKPMPSSRAPSTSSAVTEKLFRCPSRSVNQSSTSSTPRSLISFRTSLRAPGSRRRPVLALDLRHGSSSLDATESTRLPGYLAGMVERYSGGSPGSSRDGAWTVFAVWIALLAAGGWFSLHQSDHLSGGGWEVPGSPSLRVADAVQKDWPGATPPAFTRLHHGPRRSRHASRPSGGSSRQRRAFAPAGRSSCGGKAALPAPRLRRDETRTRSTKRRACAASS